MEVNEAMIRSELTQGFFQRVWIWVGVKVEGVGGTRSGELLSEDII